ncbi:uncharacterized protein B0P05DRAFT_153647 [Gilbertella persicaria]|uniref:uncharacterized protein n=1 Tax=Gilbertella persicaria TaxID=101096 RepID=UPI002220DF9A|nr:uncharacterized protein B0P05DRAFT_153647 [Gilbertella persicaria]KAI8075468.1 hypothetical protein B0P05DRAFT_153647 [Gilbertella persicaria]
MTVITEDKYALVDAILSANSYYGVLGLTEDSTIDDIRRAYIRKSRICHPDKFVPPHPNATKSFQILSTAYITLSEPTKKLTYDTQQKTGQLSQFPCCSEDNAIDIFQQVIQQLYIEIMDGEFRTLRTVIRAMNEANTFIQMNDDSLSIVEAGILKIRDIILCKSNKTSHITLTTLSASRKYYGIIQFELLKIYELQEEIRSLSYFDVWRRVYLSFRIAKTIIQIPLLINNEIKKSQGKHEPLGLQIEYGLQHVMHLFEAGEEMLNMAPSSPLSDGSSSVFSDI